MKGEKSSHERHVDLWRFPSVLHLGLLEQRTRDEPGSQAPQRWKWNEWVDNAYLLNLFSRCRERERRASEPESCLSRWRRQSESPPRGSCVICLTWLLSLFSHRLLQTQQERQPLRITKPQRQGHRQTLQVHQQGQERSGQTGEDLWRQKGLWLCPVTPPQLTAVTHTLS